MFIDEKALSALNLRGVSPGVYESTPAPFNTLLWRSVAIAGDQNYEIWTSVFDEIDDVQIVGYPRNLELLEPVANHPSVQQLQWFTKGSTKLGVRRPNFLSDLRMGIEGSYVFNFEVAKEKLMGWSPGALRN